MAMAAYDYDQSPLEYPASGSASAGTKIIYKCNRLRTKTFIPFCKSSIMLNSALAKAVEKGGKKLSEWCRKAKKCCPSMTVVASGESHCKEPPMYPGAS
jgi:hypothetical protein